MSAWGTGSFDNDDSGDWVLELSDSTSTSFLKTSIDAVLTSNVYIEAPEGSRLLCACEVIAAKKDNFLKNLPREVKQWMSTSSGLNTAELIPGALHALELVLSERSELNQLWMESESDFEVWRKTVLNLVHRLSQ